VPSRLEVIRALAHPLRLQMLSLLTGAPHSAAELARELGGSQANASYHLRRLEQAGLVVLVEQLSVRGGQARRYRHVASNGPEGPSQDREVAVPGLRESELEFASLLALGLTRRYAQRDTGPKTDVDAELWVDPALWSSVVDEVNAASARLHAAAVAPRTPGTVRVSMTASLFTMRPPGRRR